jgi:hypothetical protein
MTDGETYINTLNKYKSKRGLGIYSNIAARVLRRAMKDAKGNAYRYISNEIGIQPFRMSYEPWLQDLYTIAPDYQGEVTVYMRCDGRRDWGS